MISRIRKFKKFGLLGMNRRNGDFISKYNKRRFYPRVDDKSLTKNLALENGVAVPDLYATLRIHYDVRNLASTLEQHDQFVLKPARGSGGEGIIVIGGRSKKGFKNHDGKIVTFDELKHHASMILGGIYSLGGHPDKALVEQRVQFDSTFEKISYLGVPDIRVIVCLGVPVMAMVRLPTRASNGKANLHQGALGVGIDISTGTTLSNGVWGNDLIDEHPDTGVNVSGVQIPDWDKLLMIASQCHKISGLGYLGVDLVLDKHRGPLLLELNARPGLNIQIANQKGLLHRLQLVEQQCNTADMTQEDRIDFAKNHFVST